MLEELQKKLKVLQGQLQLKVNQLQNIENARNQLTNDIVEMRGKVKMLDELIAEETSEKPKEEIPEKK